MKRILFALLCVLLIACTACSSPTVLTSSGAPQSAVPAEPLPDETPIAQLETAHTTYPATITDLTGFETTLSGADRIVSLTPSNTEILITEGAADRIVGVDTSSADIAPGAEVVGDYTSPDIEQIVALEPDVVFAGNTIQQETIAQLRSAGVPVIASEATYWNEVGESFELIGQAVDENAAAEQLTQQLQGTIADVEALAPAEQMTCYYVLSFGDEGNWTSGEGSFINEMIQYAGGVPITKGSPSTWLEYPLEDLVAADPQCLIIDTNAGSYEDLAKEPGYAELSAVRNGMVFSIDSDTVSRPGPNLNRGLLSISGILNAAASGPAVNPPEVATAETE